MTAEHTPVTEQEAAYLHAQGWSSGFGWKDELDWYWEPSAGPAIWITDDIEKMRLWCDDRRAYALNCRQHAARENALELLELLEEYAARDSWGGFPTGGTKQRAQALIEKINDARI